MKYLFYILLKLPRCLLAQTPQEFKCYSEVRDTNGLRKVNSIIFCVVLIFNVNCNLAQYTVSTFPVGMTNLSTSTLVYSGVNGPWDNVTSSSIPLGFTFNFFGTAYTNIYINTNGFISFSYPKVNMKKCLSKKRIISTIIPVNIKL
mgnify:CR=1 FL=1